MIPSIWHPVRSEGTPRRREAPSMAASALLFLVRVYQQFLSPLMPLGCRFYPSCSHYTCEAIANHGAAKGILLGARRILRCHPFSHGGFDPVPTVECGSLLPPALPIREMKESKETSIGIQSGLHRPFDHYLGSSLDVTNQAGASSSKPGPALFSSLEPRTSHRAPRTAHFQKESAR